MDTKKPVPETVNHSLELDERLDLQITGWRIQTIGLILIFGFVLLAALGFFGDGVLSKRKQVSSGMALEFDRYARFESRTPIKVKADVPAGELRLSLPSTYLERFRVETIVPEPAQHIIGGNKVTYVFPADGPATVVLYLIPQDIGSASGELTINQTSFTIDQFIYP